MNQDFLYDEPITDAPAAIPAPIPEGAWATPPTYREAYEAMHPPTPQPKPEPVLEELVSRFNGLKAARAAARAKANETESVRREAKKRFDDITLDIRDLRAQLGEVVGTDEEGNITSQLSAKRLQLADAVDRLEASTTRAHNFSRTEGDEAAALNREGAAWSQVARLVSDRELALVPAAALVQLQRSFIARQCCQGSPSWPDWLAGVFASPNSLPKDVRATLAAKVWADHKVNV